MPFGQTGGNEYTLLSTRSPPKVYPVHRKHHVFGYMKSSEKTYNQPIATQLTA